MNSAQIAIAVIIENITNVKMSRLIASCFLPSKYHNIGLPNINEPTVAAESTKSESMMIGANTVSGDLSKPDIFGT